jgi:hypothetical protein
LAELDEMLPAALAQWRRIIELRAQAAAWVDQAARRGNAVPLDDVK